jgi:Ca-activated chloride channel homolog
MPSLLRFVSIAAVLAALLPAASVIAQGDSRLIMPPPPPHPVIQRDLTLTDMKVDVRIDGAVAQTTIRQTLRNDGTRVAEGQYLLPLPRGASVSNFAINDGDTRLEAKLLPAEQARRTYQEIVRQMRDPGLLEFQDSATYSVSVFPFQPGQSRTVEVKFQQTLGGTTDLVKYELPLRWAGWSRLGQNGGGVPLLIKYEVNSSFPLGSINSPNYSVSVNRQGEQRAFGSYEANVTHFSSDFTLNIGRRTGEFAATLACYPGTNGEDGYFLLSLLAAMPKQQKHIAKDVVFILDKSGSMEGEKFEQARGGLRFVLDQLQGSDRFNMLYYSDAINPLFPSLSLADATNLGKAREEVTRLTADGGTAIYDALEAGSRQFTADSSAPKYALFLTDGLPTVGNTDVNQIIEAAKKNFAPGVKLFVFGVGYDVNTTLLDSLSYDHHGTATYVAPGENLEAKVSEFYSRIASPALTNIRLDLQGLDEYELMPREMPDLFHNNEVFITGRYKGAAPKTVTVKVSGTGDDAPRTFTASVTPVTGSDSASSARLWATRKVSWLIDQVRLKGDNKELIDEIERLATRFGIVTPYTSYLITEPGMAVADRRRELEENIAMARDDESGQMAVGRSAYNQANQDASKSAAPQTAGQTAGGGNAPAAAPRPTPPPPPVPEPEYAIELPGYGGADTATEALRRKGQADVNTTVNYVNSQTFKRDDTRAEQIRWVDTRFEQQASIKVQTYSEAYFQLLDEYEWLADYLAQGESVVLVISDVALETTPEEVEVSAADLSRMREALGKAKGL